MSYTKHEFKSGEKLYASELNDMDEQIYKNSQIINGLMSGGNELTDGDNHFNFATVKKGLELTDGIQTDQAGLYSLLSDYIEVEWGKTVFINNLPTYTEGFNRRIGMFDADKNLIELGTNMEKTESQYSLTITQPNVKYIAFNIYQRIRDASLIDSLDYSKIMVTFNGFQDYKEYFEPSGQGVLNFSKPTANKKMLIFGDSITETATMNDDGSNYEEGRRINWMTFASSMLETSNFKNYAKSGGSYKDVDTGSGRQLFSNQVALAIADSSNDDAEIIVISLGTNDGESNDDYTSAMAVETLEELDKTKLHQAIRYGMWMLKTKYPNAKCFVATPIQRKRREQPVSLRNAIISMGNRYNFKVIDAEFESGIIRENEVSGGEGVDLYDGLHPNENGSRKIAELYASVILNAFSYDAKC